MTVPYEIARWDLVPGHTALVVIDDQRDFLHPDGWYAKSGIDVTHMGRDPREDPLFFASAAVAGVVAARFVGQR